MRITQLVSSGTMLLKPGLISVHRQLERYFSSCKNDFVITTVFDRFVDFASCTNS